MERYQMNFSGMPDNENMGYLENVLLISHNTDITGLYDRLLTITSFKLN
jgi:hypothetical protein